MLKVFVSQVGCDVQTGNAVVVLNEPGCEKMLPIWIGVHEASAICWAMQDVRTTRPLTHQLLLNTMNALNYSVQKVEITEIKNRAFIASLYVVEKGPADKTGKTGLDGKAVKVIDARPSDAIVLAILSSAPIYVSPSVLEQAAVSAKDATVEFEKESSRTTEAEPHTSDDEEFKKFLSNLKASDFKLPGDQSSRDR